MTRWRYALYDLLTKTQLLEHVPFQIDEYTQMLDEAGTLTATLSLSDPAVRELKPRELILPRRTTLVLLRDEVVVWEGIIWTRRRRRAERVLEVSASELRSYFDKRRVLRPELGYGSAKTLAFTSADMFDVFRTILADAQGVMVGGVRVGDIGVEADPTVLSGVQITRTDTATSTDAFHGYNFQHYGEIFDTLAHSDTPFEWRIESYFDDTLTLRRRLLLGYPHLGAAAADTNLALEYPGAIQDYEWPDDGEASANYCAALGSGDGDAMRWAEAYNATELAAGYPLAETAVSYKDDTSTTILAGHATADLAQLSGDLTVPSLDLIGFPEVSLGDHLRVRISDPDWWPGSDVTPFEATVRTIGKKVSPGNLEKTSLIIEEPRSPGD